MLWESQNQKMLMVTGGVTAGLGVCMGLYLGRRKVETAVRTAHSWRLLRQVTIPSKTIHVIKSAEKWESVLPLLYK